MRRALLLPLFILCACVPTFKDSAPDALRLEYDGVLLSVVTSKGFSRGSVGIRGAQVVSPYCALSECAPESNGAVLLQLPIQEALYPVRLTVGRVEGLERARGVIVLPGAREALVANLELAPSKKEPPWAKE